MIFIVIMIMIIVMIIALLCEWKRDYQLAKHKY